MATTRSDRDGRGRQPLDARQRHRDMTAADKELHPRCLLVLPAEDGSARRRAIVWSDDGERRARYEARGFVVAEDPYTDPEVVGRKRDVLVVRVPMADLGAKASGGDGAGG